MFKKAYPYLILLRECKKEIAYLPSGQKTYKPVIYFIPFPYTIGMPILLLGIFNNATIL